MTTMPQAAIEKLGHYVYLYVDPRDEQVFYIGKGVGTRALSHLSDTSETEKVERIEQIRDCGMEPRIEILAHNLRDEEEALRIEAAAIDLIGVGALTNQVRGYARDGMGRTPLAELIAFYAAPSVEIVHPVLLIRVNRLYHYDMSDQELYEATRGVWRVGTRRENVKYAFAVFRGIVREVYEVEAWFPAGSTTYDTRVHDRVDSPGRWEFVGSPASESIRSQYLNRSVEQYLPEGAQNPIRYVSC